MNDDIAALVGSRICHDLISPIGAISNGVELLSLTDGDSSQEMALISESVENANARIRFFRIAYGASKAGQMIGRGEVLSVLAATARGGRFTYFWQIEQDEDRQAVRIAFLLMQCFETAMPIGGDIHVAKDGDAWILTAVSDRLNIDEALWQRLTAMPNGYDVSAAQVQFALLPTVLADAGRQLELTFHSDRIAARF